MKVNSSFFKVFANGQHSWMKESLSSDSFPPLLLFLINQSIDYKTVNKKPQ